MKDIEHNQYSVFITKEELSALPMEKFEGKIVVVSSEQTAEKAIEDLRNAPVIGFDTETKPNFKKGQMNHVALLQLSTDSKCYLFRLSKIGFIKCIRELLEDETVMKVGLSIKDDFLNLTKLNEFKPAGFIDLQDYAKEFKIKDLALTKIHSILFDRRISKGQQLSNWEASTLNEKQRAYAALDAVACVKIYNHLKNGQFKPEESKYYRKEDTTSA